MKLYNVPRNSLISVPTEDGPVLLNFSHIDGMYSYCTDAQGDVVHLAAYADVELVN